MNHTVKAALESIFGNNMRIQLQLSYRSIKQWVIQLHLSVLLVNTYAKNTAFGIAHSCTK